MCWERSLSRGKEYPDKTGAIVGRVPSAEVCRRDWRERAQRAEHCVPGSRNDW